MRKLGLLKPNNDIAQSVLLYQMETGETYAFLYKFKEDDFVYADEWYESLTDAEEVYTDRINGEWIVIADPLPFCQSDAIMPIRVKGRDKEPLHPHWGEYEILIDGEWKEYISKLTKF
jgi:hypothetical protein